MSDVCKARDYRGAIAMYTLGIDACLDRSDEALPEDYGKAVAALYGNRAASHVMILGYEQVNDSLVVVIVRASKWRNTD